MSMPCKSYTVFQYAICLMVIAFTFNLPEGGSAEEAVSLVSPVAYVRSFSGTIELKRDTSVVVMEGSFSVTEKTVILDEKGEQIPFDKLATPCVADIIYQLRMDQDPLCLKIRVEKIKKNTRSRGE